MNTKSFIQSVTILVSGTALSQILPILASPILTRLYTPGDFGLLAVFLSFSLIITQAVTGKYEVAMMLPKQDRVAIELFSISVWFALVICFLYFLLIFVFHNALIQWLEMPKLNKLILFSPMVLFVAGVFNVYSYFANRYNKYKLIAYANFIRSFVIVGFNISFGVLGIGFIGLLIGNLLGLVCAFAYLFFRFKSSLKSIDWNWSVKKIAVAKRYIDYPVYNASSGLLSGVTVCLPFFFLNKYFSIETVGYYVLVMRTINIPFQFLSSSISKVNLKYVVDLANNNIPITPYLFKVSIALFVISLPFSLVLIFFGDIFFILVFGEQWSEAGVYVQILSFSLSIKFVTSSIAGTLGSTNNSRYGALWKVVVFFFTLIVWSYFSAQLNVNNLLFAVVINDVFLHFFYYYLIIKAAKNPKNNIKKYFARKKVAFNS